MDEEFLLVHPVAKFFSFLHESLQLAVVLELVKANREAAEATLDKLKDNRKLQAFMQEAEELCDWVDEKELFIQEESTRSLPSKLQKHQAFEAELAANRDRLKSLKEVSDR